MWLGVEIIHRKFIKSQRQNFSPQSGSPAVLQSEVFSQNQDLQG